MKRDIVCLAFGFVVLAQSPLTAQPGGPRGNQDATRHGWLASLAEGKSQAQKTGKPLMAVVRCVP